jgi:alpha-glucosidase
MNFRVLSKVGIILFLGGDFLAVRASSPSAAVAMTFDPQQDVLEITQNGQVLLRLSPLSKSIRIGFGGLTIKDSRGSFQINEKVGVYCSTGPWQLSSATEPNTLKLLAELQPGADSRCQGKVGLRVGPASGKHTLMAIESKLGSSVVELNLEAPVAERMYGFGQQFSYYNFRGQEVPILTQEQGVGRGKPLVTQLVNAVTGGSAGDEFSTYLAMPYFLTNLGRGMVLENTEYSVFDLRGKQVVKIRVHSADMRLRLFQGQSMLDLVEAYTEYAGRFGASPDWIHDGVVLGLTGGTDRVRKIYLEAKAEQVPVAALWIQDWSGLRKTTMGKQVWWNWHLDSGHYQDFEAFRAELESDGVRLLGYVNPYLVEPSTKNPFARELFTEAKQAKFLVENDRQTPYLIENTDFSAAIVDLANPLARRWMKDILRVEMYDRGFSGWMADYGEGLPFDGVLHLDQDPLSFHNQFAVEWNRVQDEFLREENLEEDVLIFTRSGFTTSPGYTRMNWLGDQLTTWDEFDGLKSAVKGHLNAGISGVSLTHSDIGGFTTVKQLRLRREPELLQRWAELAVFTSMMRTHEGNQPEANAQVYSDVNQWRHLRRMGVLFQALKDYRKGLYAEAQAKGYPVMRHPLMYHQNLSCFQQENVYSFFYGPDVFVAPVLDPGQNQSSVILPPGSWIHLWSGKTYAGGSACKDIRVASPVGQPPVFFRVPVAELEEVIDEVKNKGLLDKHFTMAR